MRIVRFAAAGGAQVGYLDGETVVPVGDGEGRAGLDAVLDLAMAANADPELRPEPVADGEGRSGLDAVLDLAMAANAEPGLRPTQAGEPVPVEEATLLAPVIEPPSIRDFYAFEQHVRTARARRGLEMHPDWYELPIFYFTNPAAVIGPGDPVAAPPRSAELDYELEVACVLGRDGANLRVDVADRMVAGFMVLNDWSARDVQRREMQLSLGPAKG